MLSKTKYSKKLRQNENMTMKIYTHKQTTQNIEKRSISVEKMENIAFRIQKKMQTNAIYETMEKMKNQ